MSEESSILPLDSTQGRLAPTFAKVTVGKRDDIVSDEFLREEIGCCPTKGNESLEERDLSAYCYCLLLLSLSFDLYC